MKVDAKLKGMLVMVAGGPAVVVAVLMSLFQVNLVVVPAVVLVSMLLTVMVGTLLFNKKIASIITELKTELKMTLEKVVNVNSNEPVQLKEDLADLTPLFNKVIQKIEITSASRNELNEELAIREQKEQLLSQINTDLKAELQEKSTALARSNNNLDTFSSSIANDLIVPLRHILGFTEIFKADAQNKLDAKMERDIQIIINSAKNMEQMIEDLLNYSQLGRRELMFSDIDMNDLLQRIVNWHNNHEEKKKIVWTIRDLPSVKGDALLVQMAFSYLISNALKFTKNVNPVEIEVGAILKDHRTAVFYVKDNGIGFDPRYKERLFGIFQRLHSRNEFDGNGIGLANVSQIIQRHGGTIWADSQQGKGATFYFTMHVCQNIKAEVCV